MCIRDSLLTLNRRVLLNDKENLRQLLQTLIEKSAGMPIVAPMHTYVRNAIKELGIEAPNLHIMPPQNYLFFGYLINKAKGIITDSGNVAEEATFLGIPCITLNTYAEHPETWRMGTNELVGEDPVLLAKAMDLSLIHILSLLSPVFHWNILSPARQKLLFLTGYCENPCGYTIDSS